MSLNLSFVCAGLHWSIPVENLRPLLEELRKDIEIWISQEKPVYADSWKPQKAPIYLEPVYTEASQSKYVECSWKSYPFAEYFKKKKIDPKFDSRYSKFYTNQRHTIAGSYVWAETDLSDFADELEKPLHSGKLSWLDVLINCQYKIENSPQVVGLTGDVYNNCEVLISLSASIFKRACCLLEAANYTKILARFTVDKVFNITHLETCFEVCDPTQSFMEFIYWMVLSPSQEICPKPAVRLQWNFCKDERYRRV